MARLDDDNKQQAWEGDPRILMLQRKTKLHLSALLVAEKDEDPLQRCVATITWSCAKLNLHDADMMSALGDLAVRLLRSFKPFELANVLWGFAKLQVRHEALFQLAHDHVLQSLELFPTRSLSAVAWSFSALHLENCEGLLCSLADTFVMGPSADDEATPSTIANMVWALAGSCAQVPREVLEAIGHMAASRLQNFKVHELSVALCAFARLGACQEELFARAAELLCVGPRLRERAQPQVVANLLWAFARYGEEAGGSGAQRSQEVLAALLPILAQLLPRLDSVEISASVWAVSKLVPRSGKQPIAESILLRAAKRILAEPQLLMGMSHHSGAGLLSAYSEFFHPRRRAPPPCCELRAWLADLFTGHAGAGAPGASQLEASVHIASPPEAKDVPLCRLASRCLPGAPGRGRRSRR